MQSTSISQPVTLAPRGPNLLVRIVYYILFGLWFSGIWAAVAWLLCVTIVGLPFGVWMLNRLPQVVTLKPSAERYVVTPTGEIASVGAEELPFLLRAVYFVLVGWWLSALWIAVAWALHASIIGLPLGFWMFTRRIARPML